MEWIVPAAQRGETPNVYTTPKMVQPIELVILHYTASGTLQSAERWFMSPTSGASAHFLVDVDGTVRQLAPLSVRTWHAGGPSSSWRGGPVNRRSIGIEIVNWGLLERRGAQLYTWTGKLYQGESYETDEGIWAVFPEVQRDAVVELLAQLVQLYPVLAQRDARPGEQERICGHCDVDPSRKKDPGGAFLLPDVRGMALLKSLSPGADTACADTP